MTATPSSAGAHSDCTAWVHPLTRLALAFSLVLPLVGCVTLDGAPSTATQSGTATPEESLSEIASLVAATTEAAGGTWDVTQLGAQACSLPEGASEPSLRSLLLS